MDVTDLLAILTSPRWLECPWRFALPGAAFIIRDQGRGITRLEELREKDAERLDKKLDDIYTRVNDLAVEVARREGNK